ncbi:hypothetical protein [Bradyrhizobium shewense]|uniref:hypothetical protein n=1 Tax=Bradyrhizobium shewense TaxID=1761772 RepID=UPI0032219D43
MFSFELRGSHKDAHGRMDMAFIDMGDQLLALSGGRTQPPDTGRHPSPSGFRPLRRHVLLPRTRCVS